MKKLFSFILILIFVLVFFLGYIGFIPVISEILGTNKPKDLGIKYSDSDKTTAVEKLQVKFSQLSPNAKEKGLVLKGFHPVDKTFSSQELTALADTRQKQFGLFPFKNAQIKINKDGTAEGSAVLEFNTAVDFLQDLGVSLKQINQAVDKFKILKGEIPVYLKVSGDVSNNVSNIAVKSVEISKIRVPQPLVNLYGPNLNNLVEDVIAKRKPHYGIKSLKIEDGKVHFNGTSPDEEFARGK